MKPSEPWGDYVPDAESQTVFGEGDDLPGEFLAPEAPVKRPRILFTMSVAVLAAFELGMTIYFFVAPSRHRPTDLVGEWILGSAILICALAYSLGERMSDLIDLGTRSGRVIKDTRGRFAFRFWSWWRR